MKGWRKRRESEGNKFSVDVYPSLVRLNVYIHKYLYSIKITYRRAARKGENKMRAA